MAIESDSLKEPEYPDYPKQLAESICKQLNKVADSMQAVCERFDLSFHCKRAKPKSGAVEFELKVEVKPLELKKKLGAK